MRLTHRVTTRATPAEVWAVLGTPARWPEFDLTLRAVRGTSGAAVAGQHLMAAVRALPVAVPVDVVEVVPARRLVLRFALAPGLAHEVTTELVERVHGGTSMTVRVVVDGVFARPAALPVWAFSALTSRVLAARCERTATQSRRLSA